MIAAASLLLAAGLVGLSADSAWGTHEWDLVSEVRADCWVFDPEEEPDPLTALEPDQLKPADNRPFFEKGWKHDTKDGRWEHPKWSVRIVPGVLLVARFDHVLMPKYTDPSDPKQLRWRMMETGRYRVTNLSRFRSESWLWYESDIPYRCPLSEWLWISQYPCRREYDWTGGRIVSSSQRFSSVYSGARLNTPLWMIVPPLLVLPATRLPWLLGLRGRRRERLGLCAKCAYDLRGSPPDGACPECGAERSLAAMERPLP